MEKNILWDFLVSNVSDILSIYNLTFLIYFLYDWGISHFSNVFKYENLFKKSLENLKVGIGVIYLTNLTARASTPQSLHLEFHCRLLGLFLMKTQLGKVEWSRSLYRHCVGRWHKELLSWGLMGTFAPERDSLSRQGHSFGWITFLEIQTILHF